MADGGEHACGAGAFVGVEDVYGVGEVVSADGVGGGVQGPYGGGSVGGWWCGVGWGAAELVHMLDHPAEGRPVVRCRGVGGRRFGVGCGWGVVM